MEQKDFVAHIGGTFIYSVDPKSLAKWYSKHLGIEFESNGTDGNIFYRTYFYNDISTGKKAYMVLSILENKNRPFLFEKVFCVNYRVNNIESVASYLKTLNIEVKGIEVYPEGKFAWITDPEGNYIELWEDTTLN
ncbi:MAG: VOC family protein [Ignavibacteriae bacterium]|nr:VOC family protein [Ignavibacteriota bacterium]